MDVRIRDSELQGTARVVDDEDEDGWARNALVSKYERGYGDDLTSWSRSALVVAIDFAS